MHPSGTFHTGSGPLNIAANEQKQYETLCDLVGRPDLKTDTRFAERQARKVNRAALTAELETALAARSAREWEALFNKQGVPAGCVLGVSDILQEKQIVGRKFVERLPLKNHAGQTLRVTRPGFRLDEEFSAPAAPPILGQDTERWLIELGYSPGEIAALHESGAVTWAGRATVPESAKLPELKVRAESSST